MEQFIVRTKIHITKICTTKREENQMKLDEGIKRRISNETLEELSSVFEKAVREAFEAGKKSVEDKPTFKTEKRKAFTGDRVLITCGKHKGCIFTVRRHEDSEMFWGIDVEEWPKEPHIWTFIDSDYEVITEPEQVPVVEEFPDELTPNEQRAELIERARKFVEKRTEKKSHSLYLKPYIPHGVLALVEAFVVNEEKRTVVCLLKGVKSDKIYAKGIAKCMPGEVFNEHIGKAIALARALEIDVPEEFLNAVQPDKVVVGMKVKTLNSCTGKVVPFIPEDVVGVNESCYPRFSDGTYSSHFKIINDTNAIYGTSQ